MRLIYVGLALALATAAFADTITLKNGRVINGTYLGGSPRQVDVRIADRVESFDISNVAKIEFGGGVVANGDDDHGRPTLRRAPGSSSTASEQPTLRRDPAADTDDRPPTLHRVDNGNGAVIMRPGADTSASARPAPAGHDPVELPAGTNIVIRMIDGVDSETGHVGQTYNAAIDAPVTTPGGDVVIPRGADVIVKLVDSKDSGKLTGRAELSLDLLSVRVNGQMVDINTQTVSRESGSRGEKTAKVAGGAAVAGAVLGGILGGGKGALGGAAAGGAAGAGVEAVTKGERVRVPSETRLTFVLDTPLKI